MLYYTRSVWMPILAHTLHNLFANITMIVFLSDINGYVDYAHVQPTAQQGLTGNFEIDLIIFWGFISLFMIPIVILCFKKLKKNHAAEVGEISDADIIGEVDTSKARGKTFTWAFWIAVVIFAGYVLLDYFVI